MHTIDFLKSGLETGVTIPVRHSRETAVHSQTVPLAAFSENWSLGASAVVREVTNLPESEWKDVAGEQVRAESDPTINSVPVQPMGGIGKIVSGSQVAAMNLGFKPGNDPNKTRGQNVAHAMFAAAAEESVAIIFHPEYPRVGAYRFGVHGLRGQVLKFLQEYVGAHLDAEIARQRRSDAQIARSYIQPVPDGHGSQDVMTSNSACESIDAAIREGYS